MKHVNTDSLIEYLKNGPSPFHVVDKTADILENNGDQELKIENK